MRNFNVNDGLQRRNPNQVAAPSACPDSGSNPGEVRCPSVCSYVLKGGKRGDLGAEEVMRVTRVQLVDHGSVNEPLMCF